jgi:hypothetical protein
MRALPRLVGGSGGRPHIGRSVRWPSQSSVLSAIRLRKRSSCGFAASPVTASDGSGSGRRLASAGPSHPGLLSSRREALLKTIAVRCETCSPQPSTWNVMSRRTAGDLSPGSALARLLAGWEPRTRETLGHIPAELVFLGCRVTANGTTAMTMARPATGKSPRRVSRPGQEYGRDGEGDSEPGRGPDVANSPPAPSFGVSAYRLSGTSSRLLDRGICAQ